MGTKYSTVTVTSYNASPPADDGSSSAGNQITWAKHKTKLGDPLKIAVEAIDTALVAALNQGVSAKTEDYTVTVEDHNKTIVTTTASAGVNLYLPDGATAAAGFIVTLINAADSTDNLTINLTTSSDLMNGLTDGTIVLPPDCALTFVTNVGNNGYNIKDAHGISVNVTGATHIDSSGVSPGITRVKKGANFDNWIAYDMGCNGRLTLTTATPVTTSDVTSAGTVYFSPYKGRMIWLYDGSLWKPYEFTELSVSVPANADTNYDAFVYEDSGALTLGVTAWSDGAARATALATQNGVLVKTGELTHRYVGTFRTTNASQCEDSDAKRFVWNYYNRIRKSMSVVEATSTWNYTTDVWRQTNASTANQLAFVIGVAEDFVEINAYGSCNNGTAGGDVGTGIGIDSTTTPSGIQAQIRIPVATDYVAPAASYKGSLSAGYHFAAWLERSVAIGTTAWQGTAGISVAGIHGSIFV